MAAHLSALLILTALTGIHSLKTVSKVSVERGDSISVPCLYESKYKDHVKYLCEGRDWTYCSYAVKTNEPSGSGRFLISDDKQKRVFTVTINNPSVYRHYFWCAVEINHGPDIKKFFQLSVNQDRPQLSVDHQEVTGFSGEDVTINCHYTVGGESRWCRLGGSCVKEPSGSIEGTKVTINVKDPQVFSVTLSGLMTRRSGWYYCAKGGLQMPVHLTVKEKQGNQSSVIEEHITVQTESQSADLPLLAVILPLLMLSVTAASIVWLILRRQKRTNRQPAEAEDELTYSPVTYTRQSFNKAKDELDCSAVRYTRQSVHKAKDESNYSAVTYTRQPAHKDPAPDEEGFITSTTHTQITPAYDRGANTHCFREES